MASTPEKKVKLKVRSILDWHEDVYCFTPMTGGYGRSGVPDIVGCHKGRFFAIECKAGNNTTTALQERELQKIRDAGGIALVVNEENIDAVKAAVQAHTGHRL